MDNEKENQLSGSDEGENIQNIPEPDEYVIDELKRHQNLNYALVGGFITMLISALIWAAITVAAKYQIGYMALAVGLLVGFAVRFFGAGIEKSFGYAGALFALLGCVLGNLFSQIGFFAQSQSMGYFEALSMLNTSSIIEVMKETFSPMDLLFYAIAAYEGYKFSFRRVTPDLVLKIRNTKTAAEPANNNLRRPLVIASALVLLGFYFVLSRGVNGHQIQYYESGEKMAEGELKDSKQEGLWTYYYKSGVKEAAGSFVNGINDGTWKWYSEQGKLNKISSFQKGLEHGAWITYYENGIVSDSGNYVKGRMEGKWIYNYENGMPYQIVSYNRNQPEGLWVTYFQNGNINSSGNYQDGKQSGIWKTFYENGNPETVFEYRAGELVRTIDVWDNNGNHLVKNGNGIYKHFSDAGKILQTGKVENGKRTGKWILYYENGKMKEEWIYDENSSYRVINFWDANGKHKIIDGIGEYTTYMPDGKTMLQHGNIKDGYKEGLWKIFNGQTGKAIEEDIYKNGKLNGMQRVYYESGQVYVEGMITDDKREGEWIWYFENGTEQSRVTFKNDKKNGVQTMRNYMGDVMKEEYYEDGNLVNEKMM